jgi:hypothetical protein
MPTRGERMIDNDVICDIATKGKDRFIPLYLGRAGILPSDNQEWCGVWLHGALLSIDTRAVLNPARNMVQSLYTVKDYTIRAMKTPDAAKVLGTIAQITVVKATTHDLLCVLFCLYIVSL